MGGAVDSVFGGGQSKGYEDIAEAIKQAMAYQKSMLPEELKYMQPFFNAGTGALPEYQKSLEEIKDPVGYYSKILGGYSESPQAKLQMEEGIRASNAGAAASGLLGSGAQQKELTEFGQKVSNSDQQRFLQNVLGIRGDYTSGLQDLMGRGFNAGTNMSNLTAGTADSISKLMQALGQANYGKDVSSAGGWNKLLSMAIPGIGGYLGGSGDIGSGGWAGALRGIVPTA